MDRFVFAAALGATLVRVGNFFNSEIVGKVTDQTWGVRFPRYDQSLDAPFRHPTQIYEVALGLTVLGLLYLIDKAAGKEKRPRGLMVSCFFILYFGGRFFIEFFKELQVESIEKSVGFTMGQILSVPCFVLGLVGLVICLKKRVPVGWYPDDLDDEDEEEDDEDDEEEDDEDRGEDGEEDEDAEDEPEKRKPVSRRSPKPEVDKSGLRHDADVDEEFSMNEEERRKKTREELKKEDE
jgi:hypothetical protein